MGARGSREVAPSVWQGGDLDKLADLTNSTWSCAQFIRPVVGYVGWSPEQLSEDLRKGVWVRARLQTASDARDLCVVLTDCWKAALRGAGLDGMADFPRSVSGDKIIRRAALSWGRISITGLEPIPKIARRAEAATQAPKLTKRALFKDA